ncbi:MAG: peptide deformylase [Paracoccaceae bacterium]
MADDGAGHRAYLPFPNPILRAKAAPVDAVTDEICAIWDEMLRAMYAMPGSGVGLAAPQLGISLRLAVVDCSDTHDQPVRLANPVLIAASERMQTITEGSPNMPDLHGEVARPDWVEVSFTDETGTGQQRRFDGLWSTSIQHQIDHLDGRMFFDRMAPMRRRRILEAHKKAQRARKRA